MLIQPLRATDAKKQILLILADGEIVFRDPYFAKRMAERNVSRLDVINTLRAGRVREAENEQGEWRHHVWTASFTVVVAFPEEMLLACCTCWRNNK